MVILVSNEAEVQGELSHAEGKYICMFTLVYVYVHVWPWPSTGHWLHLESGVSEGLMLKKGEPSVALQMHVPYPSVPFLGKAEKRERERERINLISSKNQAI